MSQVNEYKLYNRYGDETKLVRVSDNEFEFVFNRTFPYSVTGEPGNIYAIDPAGGPCVVVGSKILEAASEGIVQTISENEDAKVIITFKKD